MLYAEDHCCMQKNKCRHVLLVALEGEREREGRVGVVVWLRLRGMVVESNCKQDYC